MGMKLREIRQAQGLTQVELSFMAHVPPGEISRIECGWVKPTPRVAARLARALGVPVEELMGEEPADEGR